MTIKEIGCCGAYCRTCIEHQREKYPGERTCRGCKLGYGSGERDINFDKLTRQQQKLPWLPLEKEIDMLIAGCSRKIATFLQMLKETWCRSGEAWRIEWTEVDFEHNIVTINSPEKNGAPCQFKMSSKLTAMLNMLPKTNHRLFGTSTLTKLRQNFMSQRARIAHKLQNPRITRITFHTLRH